MTLDCLDFSSSLHIHCLSLVYGTARLGLSFRHVRPRSAPPPSHSGLSLMRSVSQKGFSSVLNFFKREIIHLLFTLVLEASSAHTFGVTEYFTSSTHVSS